MGQDQAAPVLRFYEGWNAGAIGFDALVADEMVNHQPGVPPEMGKQAFIRAVPALWAQSLTPSGTCWTWWSIRIVWRFGSRGRGRLTAAVLWRSRTPPCGVLG